MTIMAYLQHAVLYCAITDADEFCQNIQEYSAQIHGSPVTGYSVRGLMVSVFWSCFFCGFFFTFSLVKTFTLLKGHNKGTDTVF